MNWKNIDLKSDYELSQPILDPYSTETLLLEITCNVRDINRATVTAQFIESLNQNIRTAKEIFADNLDNIVKEATRQRNA